MKKMKIYGKIISTEYNKENYSVDIIFDELDELQLEKIRINCDANIGEYENLSKIAWNVSTILKQRSNGLGIGNFNMQHKGLKIEMDNKYNLLNFKIMNSYREDNKYIIMKDITKILNRIFYNINKFNSFIEVNNGYIKEYNIGNGIVLISNKDNNLNVVNCNNFLKGINKNKGIKIMKSLINIYYTSDKKEDIVFIEDNGEKIIEIKIEENKVEDIKIKDSLYNKTKNLFLLETIFNNLK